MVVDTRVCPADDEADEMLASYASPARTSSGALHRSQDLASAPEAAFTWICQVEKWPVWLSFLKSARRVEAGAPLTLGSEIALRSAIPGDAEELYEVDQFLDGYIVSLVGAYSLRRRIDFRIERKSERSKIVVRIDYPSYGGVMGAFYDRMTVRRKLDSALGDSLLHFKGLVEFKTGSEDILADF